MKTVAYPFQLNSAKMVDMTSDVGSQIQFVLNFLKGTRLGKPDYGLAPLFMEQVSQSEISDQKGMYVFLLQKALASVPIKVENIEISKNETEVLIDITYQAQGTVKTENIKWPLTSQ